MLVNDVLDGLSFFLFLLGAFNFAIESCQYHWLFPRSHQSSFCLFLFSPLLLVTLCKSFITMDFLLILDKLNVKINFFNFSQRIRIYDMILFKYIFLLWNSTDNFRRTQVEKRRAIKDEHWKKKRKKGSPQDH